MHHNEYLRGWTLLARTLMKSHGVYFAASLMRENGLPIEFALVAVLGEKGVLVFRPDATGALFSDVRPPTMFFQLVACYDLLRELIALIARFVQFSADGIPLKLIRPQRRLARQLGRLLGRQMRIEPQLRILGA